MKKFSEWVKENNPGNYVSVDVTGLPVHLVSDMNGKVNADAHITLMYSKESHVPKQTIESLLDRNCLIGHQVKVTEAKVFDALDKGESTGCIVLGISDDKIQKLNEKIAATGCKHSYVPFEAHATLIYDCPLEEANKKMISINEHLKTNPIILSLGRFNNDWVKENWIDKLK